MKAIPIELLRRIARHRTPGTLLRTLLSELADGERMQVTVYQLPLWIITQAPIRGALRECDLVPCRLGATLLAGRCVDRQAKAYPSGQRKGAPVYPECQGCAIGEAYRVRLIGYRPPKDSQPAATLSGTQAAARARYDRERRTT